MTSEDEEEAFRMLVMCGRIQIGHLEAAAEHVAAALASMGEEIYER